MSDEAATEVDTDVPAFDTSDVGGEAMPDVLERREVVKDRGYSEQTRKLFAEGAKKLKAQLDDGGEDEYEPAVQHEPPVAAGGVSAGASASKATPTPAAAPASDPAAAAVDTRSTAAMELREKAIAEREETLNARETELVARETWRDKFHENRGGTLRDLIKELTGATSDDELKDEIADVISELSETGLGLPIPEAHKLRLESRKAIRTVKQYTAKADKLKAETATQAEQAKAQAEQQQRERQAVEGLALELKPMADKFPHLMSEEDPAGIVWDVIKTKFQREGQPPKWEECAALAEEHFKKKNDAYIAKRRHLLAPTAQAQPAKADVPQGDPQSRRSSTLTNRTTAPVTPTPADDGELDRESRRRRSLGSLAERVKERTAQ